MPFIEACIAEAIPYVILVYVLSVAEIALAVVATVCVFFGALLAPQCKVSHVHVSVIVYCNGVVEIFNFATMRANEEVVVEAALAIDFTVSAFFCVVTGNQLTAAIALNVFTFYTFTAYAVMVARFNSLVHGDKITANSTEHCVYYLFSNIFSISIFHIHSTIPPFD
jgi:hypothetical protein